MSGLRYAMVGGGVGSFIGAVHRKAIALDGTATLVGGAFSSTAERSRQSGIELGLDPKRAHADHRAMLEAEAANVDFVVIVTPNDSHFEIARDCLKAGVAVVCDKPFTTTSAEARELGEVGRAKGLPCVVTYNYTGYPMVREAAELIASGELGEIRRSLVEYHQGWLATPLERAGMKQAAWRTDPARAGLGGALGDIGTHAENLLAFVTGLGVSSMCAQLTNSVPGRQLDDDVAILMKLANDSTATLSASQVCVGEHNGLSLRVYGDKGGLHWRQERPDELVIHRLEQASQTLVRGGPGLSERATRATRIPSGHPEGYLEAFANVYRGVAELLTDGGGAMADELAGPAEGERGVRFIELAVESSRAHAWIDWS